MAEEPLHFPFTAGGYVHTLLAREGRVCLVERGNGAHYEIVVLQHRPASRAPSGALVPAHEGYPKTSEWGKCGWSYVQRVNAERWYRTICRRQRSRTRARVVSPSAGDGLPAMQTPET
jgi:hypothetical protein